jgi:hypothetical protein
MSFMGDETMLTCSHYGVIMWTRRARRGNRPWTDSRDTLERGGKMEQEYDVFAAWTAGEDDAGADEVDLDAVLDEMGDE